MRIEQRKERHEMKPGTSMRFHGRDFKVFSNGALYYAHTDCACGSTMSSGEWFGSIRTAVREAFSNIIGHESRCASAKECA